MRKSIWFAGLAAAVALCLGMLAAAADAPDTLTVKQVRAVVGQTMAKIAKVYVFPQKRAAIVALLKKNEAAGRYDVTVPGTLADRLTDDMRDVSHDEHMYIYWAPKEAAALSVPDANPRTNAFYAAQALRDNQGFTETRVLPGNVRYVRWDDIPWSGKATVKVMASVARFLSDGDAIVLDMRANGGGDATAVQQFVSYFMPPKRRVLMTFYDGLTGKSEATHVLVHLPGPRLTGKPLYVLTSNLTASGAEEFCEHVKLFKLGTLIGHHTAGAANNDSLYPLPPGFMLSVSTGRPVHPVSHGNWEGIGVPPDVAVPPAEALGKAQVLALSDLIAHGPEKHRADYAWALVAAQAVLDPPHPTAEALAAYAGRYGTRTVWVAGGALRYRRTGGDALILVPLGHDLFGFREFGFQRLRFRWEGGRVVAMDVLSRDGQVTPLRRSP